ncbi:hypothetical protein Trydic_g17506 [Trypoxylus dichotomus]
MDAQLVVTILLISCSVKHTASQNLLPLQQDDSGFSTNIVHQSSLSPEQQAESAINIRFGPEDVSHFSNQNDQNSYTSAYLQSPAVTHQSDEYPKVQFIDNPRSLDYTVQTNQNPPSSQSFNVGYSVKFGGVPPLALKQTKPQQTYINSDIITGTIKEEVMKPQSVNLPQEEYVLNSVLDNKKQKISGIKPKYYRPVTSSIDPEKAIAQANLSPKTQMKLQELQGNVQLNYENDPYLKKANNSPWKTLSPGVEIYKSKPIRTISTPAAEESTRFDHAKALGRSIGFDYSNVVDYKTTNREIDSFAENADVKSQETSLIKKQIAIPLSSEPKIIREESRYTIPQKIDREIYQQYSPKVEQDMITSQEPEFRYYTPKYENTIKTFTNPTSYQTNQIPFNPSQQIYQAPKQINAQIQHNFNKRLENVYKFAQQNSDPVFKGYSDRLKQFYNQYTFPTPMIDLTKEPLAPQYVNQQNKVVKTRLPTYSVKENQQDDVKPGEILSGHQKLYGKNVIYVPYNQYYTNPYMINKKLRPNTSRYVKDTKKYARPHSRNKMHPRMETY